MMPGMNQMREQLDALDEREFDRVEAMVRSMTPYERNHPKAINGSRRARIAKGSGVSVSEVNGLLERFGQAQKMMRQLRNGGGIPGMPGMPGMPGAGAGKQKKQAKKVKGKSGNPAKRAAQEAELKAKREAARQAAIDAAFGGGVDQADAGGASGGAGGAFGAGAGAAKQPSAEELMAGFDPAKLPKNFGDFLK